MLYKQEQFTLTAAVLSLCTCTSTTLLSELDRTPLQYGGRRHVSHSPDVASVCEDMLPEEEPKTSMEGHTLVG